LCTGDQPGVLQRNCSVGHGSNDGLNLPGSLGIWYIKIFCKE
jgi:hypothetical protein